MQNKLFLGEKAPIVCVRVYDFNRIFTMYSNRRQKDCFFEN